VGGESMETMVRQNLPYWDMFDLPDNPIVGFTLTPSLEFLRQEGVIRKTNARPNFSGGMAELWVRAQLEAYRINDQQEPGAWTLAQHGDRFWLPEDELTRTRVLEATLYRTLPVPGNDVSFEDILEFKHRRADELAMLRLELDSIYLSLIKEADIPRAASSALLRLSETLVAMEKVSSEAWKNKLRSTLKVEISLPSVSTGVLLGGKAAESFDLPIWLGAGLGAMAAAIKFELRPDNAGAKVTSGSARLTYARKVETELS
jgi:Family of unknown function (DUF6236)